MLFIRRNWGRRRRRKIRRISKNNNKKNTDRLKYILHQYKDYKELFVEKCKKEKHLYRQISIQINTHKSNTTQIEGYKNPLDQLHFQKEFKGEM